MLLCSIPSNRNMDLRLILAFLAFAKLLTATEAFGGSGAQFNPSELAALLGNDLETSEKSLTDEADEDAHQASSIPAIKPPGDNIGSDASSKSTSNPSSEGSSETQTAQNEDNTEGSSETQTGQNEDNTEGSKGTENGQSGDASEITVISKNGKGPAGKVFKPDEDKGDNIEQQADSTSVVIDQMNSTLQKLVKKLKNRAECSCQSIDPSIENKNNLNGLKSTFQSFKDTCKGISETFREVVSSIKETKDSAEQQDMSGDISRLKTRLEKLKAAIKKLEKKSSETSDSVLQQNELKNIAERVKESSTKVYHLVRKIRGYEGTLSAAASSLENAMTTQALKALQKRVTDLRNQLKTLTTKGSNAAGSVNVGELTKLLNQIKDTLGDINGEEMRESTQALRKQVYEAKEAHSELKTSVNDYYGRTCNAQAMAKEMYRMFKSFKKASQSQGTEGASTENGDFAKEKKSLEEELQKLQKSINDMKKAGQGQASRLEEVKKIKEAVEDTLTAMGNHAVFGNKIDGLQQKMTNLKKGIAYIGKLEKAIDSIENSFDDMKARLSAKCSKPFKLDDSSDLCYYFTKILAPNGWRAPFICRMFGGDTARPIVFNTKGKVKRMNELAPSSAEYYISFYRSHRDQECVSFRKHSSGYNLFYKDCRSPKLVLCEIPRV